MVVPHQNQVSGGRVFNTELGRALRRRGWEVEECQVAADWPWPTTDQRRSVHQALTGPPGQPVLIDGLVGSACPLEIEAAVGAGAAVVVLVHLPLPAETGLPHDHRQELGRLERRALEVATVVVTTSHWGAADLRRRYGLASVRVVVPGTAPAPVAAGSDPPVVVMAAAFTPVKNHAIILAALDLIGDLPWQAVLVGAHRDAATVRAVGDHLRTSPQSDRISLPGELRGAALERVWHTSDLLVVPSWTETYGLVVTEALARGIPAVVSRGTGAVEALTGSISPTDPAGALVDPSDPQEWAHTLRTWLTDPVRRDHWRCNALRRRAELRTWADTAADLDALLREL
jgi:glycosyltransferase involved in cell wall biosynthesis